MKGHLNRRQRMIWLLCLSAVLLTVVVIAGAHPKAAATTANFAQKNLSPSLAHPFGTDWLGHDMFLRTLAGLSLSIRLGILTACISAVIALAAGLVSALMGRTADACIGWFIDLIQGIPHILLLILISLACGRGFPGVAAGIALTHWPSLARVIRGEVLQLRSSIYIQTARRLGVGSARIASRHMLPHLFPQFATGLMLLFPHAILHEASITFLGFGLSSEQPAIGVILSESMRYLVMGKWWLAVFPGAALVFIVILFFRMENGLRALLDPSSAHE